MAPGATTLPTIIVQFYLNYQKLFIFFQILKAFCILAQYIGMKRQKKPNDHVVEEDEKQDNIHPIAWHPAFVEAIQMELDAYREFLEFYPEYQLTSEPLRIDCVVIKKTKNVRIEKNIATIFREINLLEYKSPDDYVSIDDFYKVYAYACLYASFEKVPVTSLTVSFVGSRNPRKLLGHLKNTRGYKVEETSPGIYTVSGDILPIQIIYNRRLSADENLWLRDLYSKLDVHEISEFLEEASMQGKAARIGAYLNAVTRANTNNLQEAFKLRNNQLTVDEVFIKSGLAARWEAMGEARGEARGVALGKEKEATAIAKNMIGLDLPFETVVSATKLDPEKVRELYKEG